MAEKNADQRKWYCLGCFVFFLFMNCFTFPAYNFVKTISVKLMIVNVMLVWMAGSAAGEWEAKLFADTPVWKVGFWNLLAVCAGLMCRYLLEFGEVSNTYNFVPLNMAVHILAETAVSTFIFRQKRRKVSLDE